MWQFVSFYIDSDSFNNSECRGDASQVIIELAVCPIDTTTAYQNSFESGMGRIQVDIELS
jgi:hypothetical protein